MHQMKKRKLWVFIYSFNFYFFLENIFDNFYKIVQGSEQVDSKTFTVKKGLNSAIKFIENDWQYKLKFQQGKRIIYLLILRTQSKEKRKRRKVK